ncbi:PIR protein [Plasmodium yoelii]|uniref:PIR protein n=3 Tax=Plasmodium yoelii TaxID=5861 RepID=A0AAF0B4W8_PLAYO|nr:PIR protein [Plasmodium yoelii]EAA17731.1 putative yir3 protein [Plasmodium yoelii yoelii]WBY58276.1 PIR protein [Plasmodium yoelii yoelii]CDS45015.1 YIR protein [Plasmodium yoelii]VTZ79195.1 PIR protein [Plasmodium yoelii]|eukprot:XP_022810980.2 PIR protein [Plasmodium yoelii]
MNKEVCKRFKNVWNAFPDTLDNSKNYQFNDFVLLNNNCNHNKFSNNSCNNNDFQSDLDRISAGCLYLLDEFIKDCGLLPPPARNNTNIVDYILIWLRYMLNLNKTIKNNNINDFYNAYINNCDKYKVQISELNDYDYGNYKELIDTKKYLFNMDDHIISNFYKAFKLLCELDDDEDGDGDDDENKDCKKYSEDNNEFFKKYKELENDSDITGNNSYKQLLLNLSKDYDNLKKECTDAQERKLKADTDTNKQQYPIEGTEHIGETGEISEDTSSSSSIASKLIPVLLIFTAIPIFLGIVYKYSLFGFRKRFKKQQIREKIKNIKKRMNH